MSIEDFGPRRFFRKKCSLNFKMSQMYVSHSRVAVDLGKFYNVVAPRTKHTVNNDLTLGSGTFTAHIVIF